jgi:hypothetical protein
MYNKYFFGRVASIFLVIFAIGLITPITAATGDDADIQARVTSASAQLEYSFDQARRTMAIALRNATLSTYSDDTKKAFYDLLVKMFNERLERKYQKIETSETESITLFSLLFSDASNSKLLTTDQSSDINNKQDTLDIENLIFDLKLQTDFVKQVYTLDDLLYYASGKTFVNGVKTIFFNNLKAVFANRVYPDKMSLRLPDAGFDSVDYLREKLTEAKISPLILSTDQPNVQTLIDTLELEQKISAELKTTADDTIPAYAKQLTNLNTIAAGTLPTAIDPITQNIFFTVVKTVADSRISSKAETILSNKLSNTLYTFLDSIKTSVLLNATQRSTIIGTYLPIAQLEKSIEDILVANYETTAYDTALNNITTTLNLTTGKTIVDYQRNLFFLILEPVYNARTQNKTTTIYTKLKEKLTAARNSTLLTAAQKTIVDGWIQTIDNELKDVQKIDWIIAPANNRTGISQLENVTRPTALTNILNEYSTKPFTQYTTEAKIFEALTKAFDTRGVGITGIDETARTTLVTELTTLKTLFTAWAGTDAASSPKRLTTEHDTTVRGWITTLDKEITALNIGTKTFPENKDDFDPNKYDLPLKPDILRDTIFSALQKLFTDRDTTSIAKLTLLADPQKADNASDAGLFQRWATKHDGGLVATPILTCFTTAQRTSLGTWIAKIKGEILALLVGSIFPLPTAEPYAKPPIIVLPLPDDAKDKLFEELKKQYEARDTTSIEKLTALKKYFQEWDALQALRTTTPPTPTQAEQLKNWILRISREISLLNKEIKIPDDITNPNDWIPLSDPHKTYMFEVLKKIYDARNRENIDDLTKLVNPDTSNQNGLFQKWAQSGQLKPADTSTINVTWIPTILNEIKLLKKVIDITLPIVITNWETVPPVTPPPFVQNKIFEALEKMYNDRNRSDKPSLETLKTTLTSWSTSYLLQEEQKKTIVDIWIPTITGEISLLDRANIITNLEKITDIETLITGLENFLTNNGGNPLDDATELRIFVLLQKVYEAAVRNRIYTQLVKVNALLDKWSKALDKNGVTLLRAEHVTTITTIWIPNIIKIANTVGLMGLIRTALNQTNYLTKIEHLKKIIADGVNAQVFEDTVKMSYFNALQQIFATRQQTQENLTIVRDLLATAVLSATDNQSLSITGFTTIQAGATTATAITVTFSNMLSDSDKTRVKTEMIAIIDIELQSLIINAEIETAKAQPTYSDKVTGLATIITKHGTKTLSITTQNLFAGAVQLVFNQRQKTDEASLTSLISFLKATLDSTLLAEAQKTVVRSNLLPTVELELRTLIVDNHIRALASMEYESRIAPTDNTSPYNMLDLMGKYKTDTFVAATQNLFATEVQRVFGERSKYGLATLRNLLQVISATTTTPLLAPAQQAYAKAMFNTLTVEVAINSIIYEITDYGLKLEKLLDLVLEYKFAQIVDPTVKLLFFDALKIIFGQRMSEYQRMGISTSYAGANLDTDNIDTLALVLNEAAESSLLVAQQQAATEAFADMFDIELAILVALQQTGTRQLDSANRILKSAQGKVFDTVAQWLFAILVNLTKASNSGSPLNEMLKTAVASTLLSTQDKSGIITNLSEQGITVTYNAVETMIGSTLKEGTLTAKIAAINQFNANQTRLIDTNSQLTLVSLVPQLLNQLDPSKLDPKADTYTTDVAQFNKDKQDLINLLNQLKDSKALSADQKKLITETYLPQIQVSITTTPQPTVTTTLQITPMLPPTTTLPVEPTITTIKAAITQPTTSAQIEALSILIDSATGKAIDPAIQGLYEKAINDLLNKKATYDPATLAQVLQLAQKAQTSPLVSYEKQAEIQNAIPGLTTTVMQKLEPTARNITEIAKIKDPVALINALTVLFDNASGKTFTATTQTEIATTIDKLVAASKGLDAKSQEKLLELFTKAQGSSLVSAAVQTKMLDTYAPKVSTQVATVTQPSIQAVYQATAQPTPSMQVDALNYLLEKISGKPIDTATQAELARVIQSLAKASPALDSMTQQKIVALVAKAQPLLSNTQQAQIITTLAKESRTLDTVAKQKIAALIETSAPMLSTTDLATIVNTFATATTASGSIDSATKNSLTKLITTTQGRTDISTAQAEQISTTASKVSGATSIESSTAIATSSKPTTTAIQSLINDIKSTTPAQPIASQLDEIASFINNAKNESFDTTTKNKFNELLTTIINKKGSMSAAEIEKLEIILENATTSPMLDATQKKNIAKEKQAISTTVKPPTTSDVFNAVQPGKTTSEQLSTLSTLVKNAKGKGGLIDDQTRAAFADTIRQLTANPASLDAGTLQQLAAILDQEGIADILPAAQQQEITQTIKTSIKSALAAASQPTYENIQRIKLQDDPKTQLKGLKEIITQTAIGQAFDTTTQEEITSAINELLSKQNKLSTAERRELATLLETAKSKNLITKAQKDTLANDIEIPTTSPSTSSKPTASASSKPSTSKPAAVTPSSVSKAATGDTKTQATKLAQIVDTAKGKTVDSATKQAFTSSIQKITEASIKSDDPLAISKVLTTVKKASGSSLMTSTNQKATEKQLTDALQPTKETIQKTKALASAKDQLATLNAIVNATYKDAVISKDVQEETVKAINQLIAKKESLNANETKQLKALISTAQKNNLISATEQTTFLEAVTESTAKPSTSTAVPTAASVTSAGRGDAKTQTSNLSKLLDNARGKTIDNQTIEAFTSASQELTTNVIAQKDPASLSRALEMIKKAAGNPLLPEASQKELKAQIESALQPSKEILVKAKGISSAKEQLAVLSAITSAAVMTETAFTEETKTAFKDAFKQLAGKKGSLSATEKSELKTMLNTAESKGMLSAEDKQTLFDLITATTEAAPKAPAASTTPYVRPTQKQTPKTTKATTTTKKPEQRTKYTGSTRSVATQRKTTRATK